MSPSKRKRPTAKGGGSRGAGPKKSPVQVHRLGLLVFGLLFLVLFVVVAIAEGVGDPSVPSGDVALVQNAPGDTGNVSQATFDHALMLAAAQGGEKKAPKPGSKKYEELKKAAMESILESVWLQGLAAEQGIEVSDKEIAAELKKIKKDSFKSPAEFEKFLKKSHFSKDDVNERVKLQVLSGKLQEQLREEVPKPSKAEVKDYYEAAKSTQFTTKPTRDVRQVITEKKSDALKAKAILNKDNSSKSWKKVAAKYSTDPTSKSKGGLLENVSEETLQEPVKAMIFENQAGQVMGPVKSNKNYIVAEVVKENPETVQDLKTVEAQIQSTLAQRLEQEFFTSFVADFSSKWRARTFCASGFEVSRCANYAGEAHSSETDPGCFEANPKGGRPEACPAAVTQAKPALPGSVSPLEPTGKPMAQRPRPAGGEETAAATTELPPGVIPSTGE